jgi:hypothetical protein
MLIMQRILTDTNTHMLPCVLLIHDHRSKVPRHGSTASDAPHATSNLCPTDFEGGIGHTVRINGHQFKLTGADDSTRHWLEMHL